jgi:hypothetical protein
MSFLSESISQTTPLVSFSIVFSFPIKQPKSSLSPMNSPSVSRTEFHLAALAKWTSDFCTPAGVITGFGSPQQP